MRCRWHHARKIVSASLMPCSGQPARVKDHNVNKRGGPNQQTNPTLLDNGHLGKNTSMHDGKFFVRLGKQPRFIRWLLSEFSEHGRGKFKTPTPWLQTSSKQQKRKRNARSEDSSHRLRKGMCSSFFNS